MEGLDETIAPLIEAMNRVSSELRAAGFSHAELLRTTRKARTKNPNVVAAEVRAKRQPRGPRKHVQV